MSAWESAQKGAEFIGNLGNPMPQLWEVTKETTLGITEYVPEAAKVKQATENAKGELAQMASAGPDRSDDLLDAGLSGLKFFDEFLPLYNDWKDASLDLEKDIYSEYRKLYGIDFSAFRRDARTLRGSCRVMHDTYGQIDTQFRGLVAVWSGDAAVSATDHMSKFLEGSHSFQEGVNSLQRNVEHHVSAMEKVVKLRAESALELYSIDCGGQVPPTIEQYIKMARNESGVTLNDAIGSVVDNFGNTVKSIGSIIPTVGDFAEPAVDALKEAADMAKRVLDNEFVPAFESKLNKFRKVVCQETQDDLGKLWNEFSTASKCVPADPFAQVSPLMPM